MRLDGMVFDLDGTLTDTFNVCFVAFRETIRLVTGQCPNDDEIFARFGPSEEGMFQRWVPECWEECLEKYLAAYAREHRRIGRAFPGIEIALAGLKERGVPMAVVTGKGPRSAAISLDQLGLTPYFDRIETGSPDGNIKTDGIRNVLRHWQVGPERVAYLGDVASDIEAARSVGAIPLAAAWEGRSDPCKLRALAPLEIFGSVSEFIQWIERFVENSQNAPPSS